MAMDEICVVPQRHLPSAARHHEYRTVRRQAEAVRCSRQIECCKSHPSPPATARAKRSNNEMKY